MRIVCEKCRTAFTVDERRIKTSGSKTRCLKCRHLLIIYPPQVSAKKEDKSDPVPVSSPKITETQPKTSGLLHKPPVFRMVGGKNCPLYEIGDEFQLAGSIFTVPPQKAPCMILAKDMVNIFKENPSIQTPPSFRQKSERIYECSGCRGMIRFAVKNKEETYEPDDEEPQDDYVEVVIRGLSKFPVFQALDDHVSRDFAAFLKFDEFAVGDLIIKKGDPGRNLYIIVTGKVEVMGDDEMRIAVMGKGEVFGEMSLLSGNTVGATINAIEPTTVLFISAQNLKMILNNSPSLQMFFTRLLAGRMAEINQSRYEEYASGLSGKLSEMVPLELFQMFHVNQKTGILTLQSLQSHASVSFREGELVRVQYNRKTGKEAFFELLKLKRGRFRFTPGLTLEEMQAEGLGEFKTLLMEGLKRIEEDDKRFLRIVVPKLV
jgi:predicted Zn finger-like uncharacterized protein